MEAGRSLREQELFYALIEGKHAAIDDAQRDEYSYNSFLHRMRYSDKVLTNFIKGYHDASRDSSGSNQAGNTRG